MRWQTATKKRNDGWSVWFAWHPVRLHQTHTMVWWEYVERYGPLDDGPVSYLYREKR